MTYYHFPNSYPVTLFSEGSHFYDICDVFTIYQEKKSIPFQIKRLSVSTTEYFFLDILFWELPFCLFIQNVQPFCNCHSGVYFRYFVPNQSVSRLTLNWELHMVAVIVIFMCSRFPGVIGSTADIIWEYLLTLWAYGGWVCAGPQMIPYRKWSLYWAANDPEQKIGMAWIWIRGRRKHT